MYNKLETADMFTVLKITKKTGLFDRLGSILQENQVSKNATKEEVKHSQMVLGMELMGAIINNIDKAEKEIYDLVGKVQGISAKEVAKQSPVKTMEVIKFITQSEELKAFMGFFTK